MSYGQLIWDVPPIKNIRYSDEIEKKEKVAEAFLNTVLGSGAYSKKNSCVSYGKKSFRIFGYDINGDTPFFNNNETIKKVVEELKNGEQPSEQIYFVMASKEKWRVYQDTRIINGKFYYLFKLDRNKLDKPITLTGPKIDWLTLEDLCSPIGRKNNNNLFR